MLPSVFGKRSTRPNSGHNTEALRNSTSQRRFVFARRAVLAALWTVACGDGGTEPPPPVQPNRPPALSGSIPGQTVAVGETVTLDVAQYFSDADGNPLTYEASSRNTAVVTVSVAGSVLSTRAVAWGETTVTATARDPAGGQAQQTFAVTVPNRGPVAVRTLANRSVLVGRPLSVDVSSHFSDPDGDALTYAATSSSASVIVAQETEGQLSIQAAAPDTAVITVSATDPGGDSAELSFEVTATQEPVAIAAVEPALLVGEAPATITGSGFSIAPLVPTQVLVDGLAAEVTSATETSVSIVVPASDCRPPRRAELEVSVGNLGDARILPVTPLSQEDLQLPEGSYRFSPAGTGCVNLPGSAGGGEYLLGVVSISEDPASLTPVILEGIPGDATIVATASQAVLASAGRAFRPLARNQGHIGGVAARDVRTRASATGGPSPGALFPVQDSLRIDRVGAHNERMARNQALLNELGPVSRSMAAAGRRRRVEVGDTITLDARTGSTCTDVDPVSALIRLVGSHTIWLEDLANPSGTFSDSELEDLDAFYAENIKDVHDRYIGDLSDVDDNGKVLVLMTEKVNRNGSAGYVSFADLLPKSLCPASNHAEIFYGWVPDPEGVVAFAFSKEQVLESYPSVLAHEIAHIIQGNAVVLGGVEAMRSWELEGGATLAAQLVAQDLFGHGSRQNLGYAEFAVAERWYRPWVNGMLFFFGGSFHERIPHAPEQCTWMGTDRQGNSGPCISPQTAIYGMPSMLFRYAMDRWGEEYPGGEQALMRRQTESSNRGLAWLEEVGSWQRERILADFYISLWVDLQPGLDAPGMRSWDLYDIFSRFPAHAHLRPYPSSSNTPRVNASVRAGSSLFVHWTPEGALDPTSIKVTSEDGGPVPDLISVWAYRIR